MLQGKNIESNTYESSCVKTIKKAPTATLKYLNALEKLPGFKYFSVKCNINSFINIVIPEEIQIEERGLCNLIYKGNLIKDRVDDCHAQDPGAGTILNVGWIPFVLTTFTATSTIIADLL